MQGLQICSQPFFRLIGEAGRNTVLELNYALYGECALYSFLMLRTEHDSDIRNALYCQIKHVDTIFIAIKMHVTSVCTRHSTFQNTWWYWHRIYL